MAAGPNLIRKDILTGKWLPQVRVTRGPSYKAANGRFIRTTAAIQLSVAIGGLSTEVNLLVYETLSVPCILGCTFINVHVNAIR